MGNLIITRPSQYANRIRQYSIRIDGVHVGYVKNGESVSISVDDGSHEVAVKIDWCRSKPLRIDVQSGGTIQLRTGCYAKGLAVFLSLVYILVPGWYVYVEPV